MSDSIDRLLAEGILHQLTRIADALEAQVPQKSEKVDAYKIDKAQRDKILDLYHKLLPNSPTVRSWSSGRQSALRNRWREHPNLNWWEQYFTSVSKSDFLSGRVDPTAGRKAFVADIDFLLRPSTVVKVLEGKYHG